jgi:hypothetical protein
MGMDQTCVEQKTTRRSLRWSYECVGTYHEEIETSNYRSYRALPDVYEGIYMLLGIQRVCSKYRRVQYYAL